VTHVVNSDYRPIRIVDLSSASTGVAWQLIEDRIAGTVWTDNVGNRISESKQFFRGPEFDSTRRAIEHCVREYLVRDLDCVRREPRRGEPLFDQCRITESWANITLPGQFHHPHQHPFSVVSGVLFPRDQPENLLVKFRATRPPIPYFLWGNTEQLITLREFLGSSAGNLGRHLILFLSDHMHGVDVIPEGGRSRVSLSFNTFWQGLVGHEENDLGQRIF
jgi:Putative 2OG-Fe(II) oxygenase